MKHKVALITGSAKGIGRSIAERLAEAGATVVLNARSAENLLGAVEEMAAGGRLVYGDVFDASRADEVTLAIERIRDRHGHMDILVNGAGVLHDKTIFDTTLKAWDNVLRQNLTSAFLCSQAAFRVFSRQGSGGRIVMIGSTAGQRGAPAGVVAYSASKAGLTGLAQTLAYTGAEFSNTVNVIAPGMIETEMLRKGFGNRLEEQAALAPLGLGQPKDVAEAVLFLVSDVGRYITGATIDVNGGLYIR